MLIWIANLLCIVALYSGDWKVWFRPKPPVGVEIGARVLATRPATMVTTIEQNSHVAMDMSIDVDVFLVTVE